MQTRARLVGAARRAVYYCHSCACRRRHDELLQVLDQSDVTLLYCWCGRVVAIECATAARPRAVSTRR
jgi:hypothetical protein